MANNDGLFLLAGAAFLTLLIGGSAMREPKGFRNNNPFNIKINPRNDWVGKIGNDGIFEKFDKMEHGVRAGYRLLKTYRDKYGINTPLRIVQKFAPKNENDTIAYAKWLAGKLNVGLNEQIPENKRYALGRFIVRYENGKHLPDDVLQRGYSLALE